MNIQTATMRTAVGAATLAVIGCLAMPAAADSIAWDNAGGDTNWSNGDNWVNDAAPSNGDTIMLGDDAPDVAQTILLDVDAAVILRQAGTGNRDYLIQSDGVHGFTAASGDFVNPAGSNSTTDLTINPNVNLVSGTVNVRATTGNLITFNGVISGAGALQVLGGAGTIVLAGDNTYTGATVLRGGNAEIHATHDNALGGVNNLDLIGGGGTLSLAADVTVGTIDFANGDMVLTLRINEAGSADRTLTTDWLRRGNLPDQKIVLAPNVGGSTGHLTLAVTDQGSNNRDSDINVESSAGTTLAFTGPNTEQTFSGVLSGDGALRVEKAASTLVITSSNTFTGGTTLAVGTLEARANGALGAGDVAVAAGAVLDIGGAGVSDVISDLATLSLDADGSSFAQVELAAGVNEIVHSLLLDGIAQMQGTFGSSSSAATFQFDDYFSGEGIITVVIPEPASLSLTVLGCLLVGMRRRR